MIVNARSKASVLIVEDDPSTADMLSLFAAKQGLVPEVCGSACEARHALEGAPDAVVLDLSLPDEDGLDFLERTVRRHPSLPVFVLTARNNASDAVTAIRCGALDYFVKPFDPMQLFGAIRGAVFPHGEAQRQVYGKALELEIEWESRAMREAMAVARAAAATGEPVLLLGEPGTGRRTLASAIHHAGARTALPFRHWVASQGDDLDSGARLFGTEYDGGAGRRLRRRGLIEEVGAGSLLLEEIDRASERIQLWLLEMLESERYCRLGGERFSRVDSRLMFSGTPELREAIARGRYRIDLFHAMSGLLLELPPLRERIEDLPRLVESLLTEIALSQGSQRQRVTRSFMEELADRDWPGNLDELRSTIRHASAVAGKAPISSSHLPQQAGGRMVTEGAVVLADFKVPVRMDDLERRSLVAALDACGGNRRRAAKRLGVSLRTVYNMIDRHGLKREGVK